MLKELQTLYPDVVQILPTSEMLKERWRGKVYLELPYTNYEMWLTKLYIASSNFCLTFVKVPLLLNHTTLYNYIFYQSQLIVFPVNNYVLTVNGFFKKLPYEELVKFYNLGKVYLNNSYKKVRD